MMSLDDNLVRRSSAEPLQLTEDLHHALVHEHAQDVHHACLPQDQACHIIYGVIKKNYVNIILSDCVRKRFIYYGNRGQDCV